MSDVKYEIEITRTGSGGTQAAQELKDVQSAAGALKGALVELLPTFSAAFAVDKIVEFGRESLRSFAESEAAANKLANTLTATGQSSQAYADSLIENASALQSVTTHSDEAILGVSRMLITFGAARNDVPRLTESVLNLATGLGKDLPEAAQLIGRAVAGEFLGFSRLGIVIDENATKGEKLASVLSQLDGKFGGLARGEVGTFQGRVKSLANAFDDLKEKIGGALAPVANGKIQELSLLLSVVQRATDGDPRENRRASLLRDLEESQKAGRVSAKAALEQRELLDASFAASRPPTAAERIARTVIGGGLVDPSAPVADTAARDRGLDAFETFTSGKRANTSAPRPPDPAVTKAVQDLGQLQEQLRVAALQGYEKEDAAALLSFQKRAEQINALARLGEVTTEKKAQLDAANFDVLNADQQRNAVARLNDEMQAATAAQVEMSREGHRQMAQFEEDLKITAIESSSTRIAQAETEFQERTEKYRQLAAQGLLTEAELGDALQEAQNKRRTELAIGHQERLQQIEQEKEGVRQLAASIEQNLAGSAAHAIVDAFRSGHFEAQKFFSDLFAMIAEAIIQFEILALIKSIATGFAGGGVATANAGGGITYAASGTISASSAPGVAEGPPM